ncbi:hypothetical protein PROPEN_04422 [Proteus penneri ATCC 35198]|nr:hypothetical protein PROPEN_04422 [Proteus penneri ATCC 35198]
MCWWCFHICYFIISANIMVSKIKVMINTINFIDDFIVEKRSKI